MGPSFNSIKTYVLAIGPWANTPLGPQISIYSSTQPQGERESLNNKIKCRKYFESTEYIICEGGLPFGV